MLLKQYLTNYELMKSADIGAFDFLSTDRVATMKSHIMFRYGLREIDFDDDVTVETCEDVFTALVKTFMQVNNYRFTKLNETLEATYDWKQIRKISESGSQNSQLSGSDTDTLSGKDTNQASGKDSVQASGKDTNQASGADSTDHEKGTTSTTTPNNYKTTHYDRTYDSDTLESTSEDIQSGSQAIAATGTDTDETTYGRKDEITFGRKDETTFGRKDEITYGKVDTLAYGRKDTLTFGKIITEEGAPIEQLEKERALAEFNFIDLICRELVNYVALENWIYFD